MITQPGLDHDHQTLVPGEESGRAGGGQNPNPPASAPRREMNTLHTTPSARRLCAYDWLSLSLVYTQVRTRPANMLLWETEARRTQEATCHGKDSLRG